MNKAYTWDSYWYAVNDRLLSGSFPVLVRDDVEALELAYNACYTESDAARLVLTHRQQRRDK